MTGDICVSGTYSVIVPLSVQPGEGKRGRTTTSRNKKNTNTVQKSTITVPKPTCEFGLVDDAPYRRGEVLTVAPIIIDGFAVEVRSVRAVVADSISDVEFIKDLGFCCPVLVPTRVTQNTRQVSKSAIT